jgi:apoptosis-inducing factor 3
VIIDGDPDALNFVAYYVKDGKIIAVSSMQRDPLAMKASELFRLGLFPSVDEIRAGKSILEIDISSEAGGKAGRA